MWILNLGAVTLSIIIIFVDSSTIALDGGGGGGGRSRTVSTSNAAKEWQQQQKDPSQHYRRRRRSPPPSAHPCSLNGDYDEITQSCICDKPWTGQHCSVLDLLPLPSDFMTASDAAASSFSSTFDDDVGSSSKSSSSNSRIGYTYGTLPNQTSWGGSILQQGSRTHLFVSVMKYGHTLREWTRSSEIQHAVSLLDSSGGDEPNDVENNNNNNNNNNNVLLPSQQNGPFIFQDIAIPVLSHNPRVVELADNTLAMFHIFTGSDEKRGDGKDSVDSGDDDVGDGSTIHLSESPYGPWKPLLNNTLGECNNPAPFVVFASCEKSHVIYIVCRRHRGDSNGVGGTLLRSENIYGPWENISEINPINDPPGSTFTSTAIRTSRGRDRSDSSSVDTTTEDDDDDDDDTATLPSSLTRQRRTEQIHANWNLEDPFLWIDRRGFHILYHAYVYETNPTTRGTNCTDTVVSAYVYSENGNDWYYGDEYPFSNRVEIINPFNSNVSIETTTTPTFIEFATRERPALVFERLDQINDRERHHTRKKLDCSSSNSTVTTHPSSTPALSSSLSLPTIQITHLLSAVCGVPSCPEQRPPGGCVNCKYDHWDFTLIQPVAAA